MSEVEAETIAPEEPSLSSEESGGSISDLSTEIEGAEEVDDNEPLDQAETADDDEEVDLDGKKYRVHKDLKDSLLRHADYTKKTQEVADQRRSIETTREALERERTQQAEFVKELRTEIGTVERLSADLKAYESQDWRAAQTFIAQLYADPNRQAEANQAQAQYNLAWNQFTALERELSQAKTQLTEKEQRLATEQTQRVQAALSETFATLEKDVPGFNPDLAAKIVDHGMKAFGLRPEEARQMADPRVWKLLHSDHAKTAEIAKLKADNAKLKGHRTAQTNNEAAQQVKPATQVRGNAPPTGLDDRLSADEWARRRNAQVAKKRA